MNPTFKFLWFLLTIQLISCSGDSNNTAQTLEMNQRERDGEALFSLHCATCHGFGIRLNGPDLIDVQQRWHLLENDLIQFIQNSQGYIQSGKEKSQYARALWEANNRIIMPSVDLGKDDIKKILEYIYFMSKAKTQ